VDSGWNHNVHYHPILLAALPDPCEKALDVGCGQGALARVLATRVSSVTGIDSSAEVIERARKLSLGVTNLAYVHGDALSYPLEGQYDFVSAVASLHHMDFRAALERMKQLLRPGGVLAVVGLAKPRAPVDLALEAIAIPTSYACRLRRPYTEPGAPVADPTMSYGQIRQVAAADLPGASFRRHLLFRYSLIWRRPA
jgi:SAM-dependent methyltransferase